MLLYGTFVTFQNSFARYERTRKVWTLHIYLYRLYYAFGACIICIISARKVVSAIFLFFTQGWCNLLKTFTYWSYWDWCVSINLICSQLYILFNSAIATKPKAHKTRKNKLLVMWLNIFYWMYVLYIDWICQSSIVTPQNTK